MTNPPSHPGAPAVALIVRRTIRASAARVFEAWTRPEHLRRWWGPAGVQCTAAEVDLRVGGGYRIANRLPSGDVVWISGVFEQVEPPRLLVYTWQTAASASGSERVTVRFRDAGDGTEVVVVHARIPDAPTRDGHEAGWQGCFDGLEALFETPSG